MNHIEKLCRYARIAEVAGTLEKGHKYTFNAFDYLCISKFFSKETSCEGNILLRTDRNDKVVVCFKGSKEFKDWFRDMWVWRIKWPFAKTNPEMNDVKIHAGFKDQYASIRMKLLRELSDIIAKKEVHQHITFCGHSLGGALSSIAVFDAYEVFGNTAIFSAYTYGSPRVYNEDAYHPFMKRIDYANRVVYADDLVPQVPISGRHVGSPVHITRDLKLEYIEYNKSPLKCKVSEHFIKNYVDALRFLMNFTQKTL